MNKYARINKKIIKEKQIYGKSKIRSWNYNKLYNKNRNTLINSINNNKMKIIKKIFI